MGMGVMIFVCLSVRKNENVSFRNVSFGKTSSCLVLCVPNFSYERNWTWKNICILLCTFQNSLPITRAAWLRTIAL